MHCFLRLCSTLCFIGNRSNKYKGQWMQNTERFSISFIVWLVCVFILTLLLLLLFCLFAWLLICLFFDCLLTSREPFLLWVESKERQKVLLDEASMQWSSQNWSPAEAHLRDERHVDFCKNMLQRMSFWHPLWKGSPGVWGGVRELACLRSSVKAGACQVPLFSSVPSVLSSEAPSFQPPWKLCGLLAVTKR